jgi:hypothetical protein
MVWYIIKIMLIAAVVIYLMIFLILDDGWKLMMDLFTYLLVEMNIQKPSS